METAGRLLKSPRSGTERSVNGALPPRDRGYRRPDTGRASGPRGLVRAAAFLARVASRANCGVYPRQWSKGRNVGRLWRTGGVCIALAPSPNVEKPPRRNPGGGIEGNWKESGLERVAPLPFLALGGNHCQSHLLAERAGNESANRMRLPAGGGHQFF